MKERTLEIIVANSIPDVFGPAFRLAAQQLSCPGGRIDLLVTDGSKNWIAELKRGQANRKAVDQVVRYVNHYRSIGEAVGGWVVAHEVPARVAEYATAHGIRTTAVPVAMCERLIASSGLSQEILSGVRIQAGVVKGGGAMRFGKNTVSFEDALLNMDEDCAAFFKEIDARPGIEIISGAMQSTIVYKGVKVGGLRRKNPVFYILSGLVVDRATEDAILNHGFRKKLKQSKNDDHQHIWYESKISNLRGMQAVCSDQFGRIDRIFSSKSE